MPNWYGHIGYIFLAWLGACLFWAWFGRAKRGNRQFWRIVEIIISVLGGCSIFLLALNAKDFSNREELDALFYSQEPAYKLISSKNYAERYFCNTLFSKSENYPAKFDDIAQDANVICKWIKKETVSNEDIKNYKFRNINNFIYLPDTKTDVWRHILKEIQSDATNYILHVDKIDKIRLELERKEFRIILLALAPYLLALVLAMQLGKALYKDA